MGIQYSKINNTERRQIERWKNKGVSNKECARRLGRNPSSIGREITRYGWTENGKHYYVALVAQHMADEEKKNAYNGKQPLKNKKIYAHVLRKLRDGWSPEQISGRLKRKHKDDPSWHISHEAIYQYIYNTDNKEKKLWEFLRRKQKRRVKKNGRSSQRSKIPDRVSIHMRPTAVDERSEVGHWKGDSSVGKGHKNGLHTAYERVSSMIRFVYMNDLTAQSSYIAQKEIYGDLPAHMKKTMTLDNGSEHSKHKLIEKETGIVSYFADPYSSWQRGGNENGNLWIRYYFPKGTDFSKVLKEELKDVEWELNTRPRKRLDFQTPLEVFTQHLEGGCGRF